MKSPNLRIQHARKIFGSALFTILVICIHGANTAFGGNIELTAPSAPKIFESTNSNDDERWDVVRKQIFGDKELLEGGSLIQLEAPKRAYDAALVPVSVKVLQNLAPEEYIKELYIVADKNPAPLAGKFIFAENAGWTGVETRIRINEYTNLRAVAVTSDDKAYLVSRYVKASGGCSAPAMGEAAENIGKFKVKMNSDSSDNQVQINFKINHPNNSGMQFDQISRLYIPPYFIHTIGVKYNGEEIIKLETNFSLSENPTLKFEFIPEKAEGVIDIYAIDSKLAFFENNLSN